MSLQEVKEIWMDGEFIEWKKANVHVTTHSLHYGTGVFEGLRGYGAGSNVYVFRLHEHIDRLYQSAMLYFMEPKWSKQEIADAIIELIRRNEIRDTCYIRPLVFRGYGVFGLNPLRSPVQVAIITFPFGQYLDAEKGARCCIASWRRISSDTLPPESKACGNYINSVLAKIDAVKNGFDEAIFLDSHGFVSEGSGENIFILKGDTAYTPPIYSSILMGITRETVIQLCKDLGLKVVERPITRTELYYSDEVFFTGTAAELTPVVNIDHRKIGDGGVGPISKKLIKKFEDIVNAKEKKYRDWLTAVY